jgi:hypothetical protein
MMVAPKEWRATTVSGQESFQSMAVLGTFWATLVSQAAVGHECSLLGDRLLSYYPLPITKHNNQQKNENQHRDNQQRDLP